MLPSRMQSTHSGGGGGLDRPQAVEVDALVGEGSAALVDGDTRKAGVHGCDCAEAAAARNDRGGAPVTG